jgi:hypothetical protein
LGNINVEVIFVKKILFTIICTILISISTLPLNHAYALKNKTKLLIDTPYKSPTGSREELYQDIFFTLLDPYISKAIKDYYGKPYSYENWATDILSVERPNGDRTELFIISLQVNPFIGAHNTVGTDNITLRVSAGAKVEIEKFEHIKSYPIPPWLR